MTALIRSELVQLRTLRSSYVVAAALAALVVAITWGAVSDATDLVTPAQMLAPVLVGAGLATAFVGALLASTRVAGEYSYGTIANRALAQPRRARLLSAKLVTFAVVGAATALAATAAGIATAIPLLAGKDVTLVLSAADVLDVAGRVVLVGTLFTVLGAIVGFISRSQQAAVVTIFGTFFVEKLLSSVLGDASGYLPFGLLNALLDTSAGSALPLGLALAAITAALGVVAAVLLRRRDVQA